MHESTIIQRALLSVFDKTNILELAETLHLHGVELISTGNTASLLQAHGLPVIPVSDYTGFPEIMLGRVKTLHPKIYGGILGRRDIDTDVMLTHNIPDIDLVVVNLYPFEKTVNNPSSTLEQAIENIDIGGPTMIRAASKNHDWCTVLVDPNDYGDFTKEFIEKKGAISQKSRFHLATKGFAHTASYDSCIANFFSQKNSKDSLFDSTLDLNYQLKNPLRYGENAHQQAAFYQPPGAPSDSIALCTQHQGKELSYNNIADSDTALECVKLFEEPACVIVKHANPCGVAMAANPLIAYDKAYACDPTSAFGGIIAFNSVVDETLMQHLLNQQFVEVLIAPSFTPDALLIAEQKPNCRVLQYYPCANPNNNPNTQLEIKSIYGGLLVQTSDHSDQLAKYEVVTTHSPSPAQLQDLKFSWRIVKYVKSNAIVFAKNGQTLGIGSGQMSRIFSTEIAAIKAQHENLSLQGAVLASDAFFPFPDNIEKAHALGITAIIQPGGSMRDQAVIDKANELGISMIFTGVRCFRH